MSHKQSQWILSEMPEIPPDVGEELPEILVRLMIQRGVQSEDIQGFLHPRLMDLTDPFLMPDMKSAVQRILQAVDAKEAVCVYGDYDVDGITSVTLMTRILEAYVSSVRNFIPRRGPEGYGLNAVALERCMKEGEKPGLLITVDCGNRID